MVILSFGQMLVVTSGRGAIDLSIPGVLTLMAFISMSIMDGEDKNVLPAILAVIAVAAVIGILNGLMVIYLQIPAIIATMAMNYILTTAALLINKNFSVFGTAPMLDKLIKARIFGVQLIIFLVILLAVLFWFLLNRTSYGKSLVTIGQNREAAGLAGIKVNKVEILTYVFSSVLAAIGGVLIAARVGNAILGMGDDVLIDEVLDHRVDEVGNVPVQVHILPDAGGADVLQVGGQLELDHFSGDAQLLSLRQGGLARPAEDDVVHGVDRPVHRGGLIGAGVAHHIAAHHQIDLLAGEELPQAAQVPGVGQVHRDIVGKQVDVEVPGDGQVDDLPADHVGLGLFGPGELVHS